MSDDQWEMSTQRFPIPSHIVKYVAYLSMVIDHIGLVLFPYTALYSWLRLLGRFAFPIFCYFIALGCLQTKRPTRYLLRLLVIAVLSEPAFSLAFYRVFWGGEMCNVMWTLLFGAFVCITASHAKLNGFFFVGYTAAFMFLAGVLHTDYGAQGVMLIGGSYWILKHPALQQRENNNKQLLSWAALLFLFASSMVFGSQSHPREYVILLLAPVFAGMQLSTHRLSKWWYFFYPAHLLLFVLLLRFQ